MTNKFFLVKGGLVIKTLNKFDLNIDLTSISSNMDYQTKLLNIKLHKAHLDYQTRKIELLEHNLYGMRNSMFYGLKYPTMFKICEYISDKYGVPYDLMMDKIYITINQMMYSKAIRCMLYENDGWINHSIYNHRQDNENRAWMGLTKTSRALREARIPKLYLGTIPYSTMETPVEQHVHHVEWRFVSKVSCKNKKQMKDEGMRQFCIDRNMSTITKGEITSQLDKIGIKYKKNMKKEELMKMLVKNK